MLRKKGKHVEAVTPEIEVLASNMLETMTEFNGIGLAAQQIGEAIQLTVIDIRPVEDRPSTLEIGDKEADPDSLMPLVLMNPELTPLSDPEPGGEGCLSFPEISAEIVRPGRIGVKAMEAESGLLEFTCGGLLARVIQHETDHLNGILFIDRMDREAKGDLREQLDLLHEKTQSALP